MFARNFLIIRFAKSWIVFYIISSFSEKLEVQFEILSQRFDVDNMFFSWSFDLYFNYCLKFSEPCKKNTVMRATISLPWLCVVCAAARHDIENAVKNCRICIILDMDQRETHFYYLRLMAARKASRSASSEPLVPKFVRWASDQRMTMSMIEQDNGELEVRGILVGFGLFFKSSVANKKFGINLFRKFEKPVKQWARSLLNPNSWFHN